MMVDENKWKVMKKSGDQRKIKLQKKILRLSLTLFSKQTKETFSSFCFWEQRLLIFVFKNRRNERRKHNIRDVNSWKNAVWIKLIIYLWSSNRMWKITTTTATKIKWTSQWDTTQNTKTERYVIDTNEKYIKYKTATTTKWKYKKKAISS